MAGRRWLPEEEDEVTLLLLVHHGGCGWHSGWYDELGTNLKADGNRCDRLPTGSIAPLEYRWVIHIGVSASSNLHHHQQYQSPPDPNPPAGGVLLLRVLRLLVETVLPSIADSLADGKIVNGDNDKTGQQ